MILARRTGKPISVFHIGLKSAHTFKKSWDLFQLPYPFARTVIFCAPPIYVPANADGPILKEKQAEVQVSLEVVRDIAESWFELTEAQRDLIRDDWRQGGLCRPIAVLCPMKASESSSASAELQKSPR
ncbi:MAG: hypothetical protein ACRD3S_06755 [Terracidiphilus sp.]